MICTTANQGDCNCPYDGTDGKFTYTFWLKKTTNDAADPEEEQRCFFLYHPLDLAKEGTKVVAHLNTYSTDWRSLIGDDFVNAGPLYGKTIILFLLSLIMSVRLYF